MNFKVLLKNQSEYNMKEEIVANIHNAKHLEKLYRQNKLQFKKAFNAAYAEINSNPAAEYWNARLNYESEDIKWGSKTDWFIILIACAVAGFLAKIPALFHIKEELYYSRNVGFIIFPLLTAYFAWKNKAAVTAIISIAVSMLAALLFINLMPNNSKSDTLVLSCIHLLLFLWSLLGIAYSGGFNKNLERRLSYLKFNGDLIVLTTLIVIAGGITTGITIGLFSLIGINIEKFYFENVVVTMLPSAPLIATYLTETNPQLVGKVSPVIARIFSPIVLVMLCIYLIAIVYSGKDPYNNREFLMVFNAMLIGVMAIIFFSVAETSRNSQSKIGTWIIFLLSLVTIIVNGIALSAILFRISEWGITPNRAAVLGGNLLILIHLLRVSVQLIKVLLNKKNVNATGNVIASYLPVYFFWTMIVTFLFPFLFGFK